ncbi:MAG: glycosyltransferase family 2 protein [bacterium]|nr:glycosyltransferase family 2 protein [bacterium]
MQTIISNNNIIEFINYLKSVDTSINQVFSYDYIEVPSFTTIKNFKYNNLRKLRKNGSGVLLYNVNLVDKNLVKNIKKINKIMDYAILNFNSNISMEKIENLLNENNIKLYGYANYYDKNIRNIVALIGKKFDFNNKFKLKKVLAVIHCYNEEDCIEFTIRHLIRNGIDVKAFDNWSTDNTYDVLKKLKNEFPQNVFIDKFPTEKTKDNQYHWHEMLENVENIVRTENYDWFIHYDADEIRQSPISNMNLQEYISYVDFLGYNAISNTILDFRVTSANKKINIFGKDTYFEFGHRPGHFIQIKTFKKSSDLALAFGGGHDARFSNRKIYPIKILLKHYPLRSIDQANKKIFIDRLPRFKYEQKKYGWHIQYNKFKTKEKIVFDKKDLILFNDDSKKKLFLEFISGVGIRRDSN